MAKKKIYLETSVISFLTARPSRDIVKLAKQEMTRQWWTTARPKYDLYVSSFVVAEISRGDAEAAKQRSRIITGMPVLTISDEAADLYQSLIAAKAVPANAQTDAMHIALAAVNGMDYLLTWNCTHINNAAHKKKIASVISLFGYNETIMATPEELLG